MTWNEDTWVHALKHLGIPGVLGPWAPAKVAHSPAPGQYSPCLQMKQSPPSRKKIHYSCFGIYPQLPSWLLITD